MHLLLLYMWYCNIFESGVFQQGLPYAPGQSDETDHFFFLGDQMSTYVELSFHQRSIIDTFLIHLVTQSNASFFVVG